MVLAGYNYPIQALAFDPDGATLTAAGYFLQGPRGWEAAVWDVATGRPSASHAEHTEAVRCLAFASGGRALAVAGQDRSLWLWERGAPRGRRLVEHRCPVDALACSGDGGLLAAADAENVVTLWDVAGGRPRVCAQGAAVFVRTLAFSPNGTTLAGGGWHNTVRLWEVATGVELNVLLGHARAVTTLAFSPDGRTLASGDLDGVVKLWDVAGRAAPTTFEETPDKAFLNEIAALAFTPDGRTLAVAIDQSVQMWDVDTGRLMARLEGHEGKVKCVAFSPDGTLLATGSHDRTVRLWNVARSRPTVP
jgi:WD40 repeat protein